MVETEDISFLKFLDQCLHWDPELRMTPDEALMHEWIVMGLPPEVYLQHCRMHIEKRRTML